jgi:hypothetical protein
MRRRNGYAAIHDLVSGSRVVGASQTETASTALRFEPRPLPAKIDGPRIGVFTVTIRNNGLIEAVDDVLRRRVWIVPQAAGATELPAARRDLARPGRLRWLQGRRSPDENWDAFEAPSGAPLVSFSDQRQPWSRVRRWLADIAEECSVALRDGEPTIEVAADRIWITTDDRAVVLDFRCPATPPTATREIHDAALLQRFLAEIANAALTPMRPLHARVLIETLAAARLEAPEIVAGNLRAALAKPATVSLRRRLFTLTLGPLIALLLGLVLCGIVPVENRHFDTWWQEYKPGSPSLRRALEVKSESGLDSKTEDALDRYLAGHFGNLATDRAFWKRAEVQRAFWLQTGSQRDILRVANDRHPSVSPEELRNAEETLRPKFDEWARFDRFIGPIAGVGLFLGALAAGAVASMVWSIVAGMPLGLRLFGLALVNREGRQASRLRVLLRTFIAALPLVGITVPWFTFALTGHMAVAAAVALLVLPLVIAVSFIHALCQADSFARRSHRRHHNRPALKRSPRLLAVRVHGKQQS